MIKKTLICLTFSLLGSFSVVSAETENVIYDKLDNVSKTINDNIYKGNTDFRVEKAKISDKDISVEETKKNETLMGKINRFKIKHGYFTTESGFFNKFKVSLVYIKNKILQ